MIVYLSNNTTQGDLFYAFSKCEMSGYLRLKMVDEPLATPLPR